MVTDALGPSYLLDGGGNLRLRFVAYGGAIVSIGAPDRDGRLDNVLLGFDTLADYERTASRPYFGALIGRYANRIGGARFTLDGREYRLPANEGPNTLHGGSGFDAATWLVERAADGATATLRHTSPDGDQGFPGTLAVAVTYTLTADNALRIDYEATTDAPTVLNLTNHSYFNLAGNGAGDVSGHIVRIAASHYTPIGVTLIPTGEIASVAGTPLDFREATTIGARLRSAHPQMLRARGYDHNWVLNGSGDGAPAFAARIVEPRSGRVLDCFTTEPGLQLYTGNFLDGTRAGSSGGAYRQGDGFTLETQHFPDSPNQPNFPSTVLRPGQTFRSTTVFRFGTDAALPPPALS